MNKKTKYTLGPWKVERFQGYLGNITNKDGTIIVYDEGKFMDEEGEANARLIAAAPELLSCLKEFVSAYGHLDDGQCEEFQLARIAISKAEWKL